MLTLIITHLRSLSPGYRAAILAQRIERARVIGYARHAARKAMLRAAAVEQRDFHEPACLQDYRAMGPGFLPRACWKALEVMA